MDLIGGQNDFELRESCCEVKNTANGGIAVAGSILVDEINTVAAYPEAGELTKILAVSKAVGGCVPNVAIDLKKLSSELPVYACGMVADDENGRFVISSLKSNGVNTDNIILSDSDRTSFTQVISISGGQRTFFTYPGTSSRYGYGDLSFNDFTPKILHLGYFLLLKKIDEGDGIKMLREAKEKGIETSIDLVSENSDRYGMILPCLPYVDYLIINELEAGRLTDISPDLKNIPLIARRLMEMGVKKKVVIHFKEGAVCCSASGISAIGSRQLPDGYIKGTTGAGDAFCAGALLGIYNNYSDAEILELATDSATAALSAEDAVSGLKDINSVRQLCKQYKLNKISFDI